MLNVAHTILIGVYVLLPILGLVMLLLPRGEREGGRKRSSRTQILISFFVGGLLGTGLTAIYAYVVQGRLDPWQAVLASYFAVALLLLLRIFDGALTRFASAIVRFVARCSRQPDATESTEGPRRIRPVIAAVAGVLAMSRVLILFAVGLPFLMSAVMTYRPRVVPNDNPKKQLGFAYERVEFESTDGVKLVGWWIPAENPSRENRRRGDTFRSDKTVIVCHGLGAGKGSQLVLARLLVPGGYNALAFDFRAHGESDGQLSSFGALEKYDVLGAVRWLHNQRATESNQIFGVGASLGGAALIGAAADESMGGQSIRAVAVYGSFDSLPQLLHSVARDRFAQPMAWLIERIGLPSASVHCGADLNAFRPVNDIARIWPRPVMVIHGLKDQIIDFQRGFGLYNAASPPRKPFWIDTGGHNDIVNNEDAARAVKAFFDEAKAVPVI